MLNVQSFFRSILVSISQSLENNQKLNYFCFSRKHEFKTGLQESINILYFETAEKCGKFEYKNCQKNVNKVVGVRHYY